jgi:NSS family neurotransmitter:Na+ symporter
MHCLQKLAGVPALGDLNPFGILDYITSNVMAPISGIGIALFVGFAIKRASVVDELGWRGGAAMTTWLWLIRVAAPIIITAIMVSSILGSLAAE